MKKLTLPLLGFFLCFISIFSSCEVKDNTPCTARYTYHALTDEEKSKTPYFNNPDFDTLRFLSNAGDTLTFALQSTDSSWYIEDANRNPNPDGCPDWQYYETKTSKYREINGSGIFSIGLYKKSESDNQHIKIEFKAMKFTYGLWAINYSNYARYVGNLLVNGITYEMVMFEYESLNSSVNKKGYYNASFGLIKIHDEINSLTYSFIK